MTMWSVVFRRSPIAPNVFNVKPQWSEQVWDASREAGLVRVHTYGMFQSSRFASPLPGGVLHSLDVYGFPTGGALRTGTRVIGISALRSVIDLLELTPPRRELVGEASVPDVAGLRAELAELARLAEEEQAMRVLGWTQVTTSSELRRAADFLMRIEEYAPPSDLLSPEMGNWFLVSVVSKRGKWSIDPTTGLLKP
jgi:hypothetical protein